MHSLGKQECWGELNCSVQKELGFGGWTREVGGGRQRTWEGSNADGWQVNALERNRLENTNIYCEEGRLEINKT